MNKYLKAITTNYLFFILNILTFLIITPNAIRIMGEEFFGLWSVLNAILVFSTIATLGINSSVTKFASESKKNQNENDVMVSGFIIVLPMALLTGTVLLLLSNLIANNIDISPILRKEFTIALKISILGIIPLFLSRVPQGFLLSQLRNHLVRIFEYFSTAVPLVVGVVICLYQRNLIWIASCYTAIQFLIFFSYLLAIRKNLHNIKISSYSVIKKMISFSIFTFLESMAISLVQNFDRVVVSFILGPTIVGVYSVGNSVGTRLSQITGQVTETMIPYASSKYSTNDHTALYHTYRKMSQYISLLIGSIASVGIIWMRELLSLWISPLYAKKYDLVFCIILLAYAFLSLARSGDQTLMGLGNIKFSAVVFLVFSIIMLSSLFTLSKRFGLIGAAAANLLMIILLVMNVKVYQILNKVILWKHVFIDLSFGTLVPIVSCILINFQPKTSLKIIGSLMIIGLAILFFSRDKYMIKLIRDMVIMNK